MKTPKHYKMYPQPAEAISRWGLNFNLGNVVKYVARAGRKEGETYLEALAKAQDYLEAEIAAVNNAIDSGDIEFLDRIPGYGMKPKYMDPPRTTSIADLLGEIRDVGADGAPGLDGSEFKSVNDINREVEARIAELRKDDDGA